MQTAILNSPLGKIEINGDDSGIASVIFLKTGEIDISETIPSELTQAVTKLKEYLKIKRTEFDLRIFPRNS